MCCSGTKGTSWFASTRRDVEKWESTSGVFMFAAAQCIDPMSQYPGMWRDIPTFPVLTVVQEREENTWISEMSKPQSIRGRSCVAAAFHTAQLCVLWHHVPFVVRRAAAAWQCRAWALLLFEDRTLQEVFLMELKIREPQRGLRRTLNIK